jgi:WD40 repeat protein
MENEMRKLFFGLTILSLLSSCTPKPIGDIYLLVSPQKTDVVKHTLLRVSSECFIKEIKCPSPEPITAFPEDYSPPYLFAPMFWSPNGKYFFSIQIIYNYPKSTFDTFELLSYNAQTARVKKIISGHEYINDLAWNPNSEWAALILTNQSNKEIKYVLVSPEGQTRLLPIQQSNNSGDISPFNPNQTQWINENEMLFIREKPEGELKIPIIHLVKFNIVTEVETEVQIPSMEDYFVLSPDGDFALFPFPINNVVNIYNFKTQKTTELKGFQSKQPLSWSPDNKWILICNNNNETYIVTPDLKKTQKITDGCTNYYSWMSDSDHIVLLFFSYTAKNFEVIESHWYIASISENTVREVTIPELDLKENNIDGIYVQPIQP